jgi:hypothetical protein
MSLRQKGLSKSCGHGVEKSGGSKMRDRAIMLLKTHLEKMSVFGLAIMSMKRNGLFQASHYVYENK